MAGLFLLRHYPTDWNVAKRIQGHADIPLSENSLQLLKNTSLSSQWLGYQWVTSPLIRAQQTAAALGVEKPRTVEALMEMDWGEFEGTTLTEIEGQISAQHIQPSVGLFFCPPGGESPAAVCSRLQAWIRELKSQTTVAVTHKGVIRAAISLATGWDMEKPYNRKDHPALKDKIDWLLPIRFEITAMGQLELQEINVRKWPRTA